MRIIFILAAIILHLNARAQLISFGNNAQIYLVRHAEKGSSGDDPLLTVEGNNRAGDLARILRDRNIQRIYVTEYKRTQLTGDSLRLYAGIPMVTYLADTSCADLLDKIKANDDLNKPILVIGHSNTIPLVIRKLALPDYPKNYIPANEFDNLFVLTFKEAKPTLAKQKYGAASGTSGTMH